MSRVMSAIIDVLFAPVALLSLLVEWGCGRLVNVILYLERHRKVARRALLAFAALAILSVVCPLFAALRPLDPFPWGLILLVVAFVSYAVGHTDGKREGRERP